MDVKNVISVPNYLYVASFIAIRRPQVNFFQLAKLCQFQSSFASFGQQRARILSEPKMDAKNVISVPDYIPICNKFHRDPTTLGIIWFIWRSFASFGQQCARISSEPKTDAKNVISVPDYLQQGYRKKTLPKKQSRVTRKISDFVVKCVIIVKYFVFSTKKPTTTSLGLFLRFL